MGILACVLLVLLIVVALLSSGERMRCLLDRFSGQTAAEEGTGQCRIDEATTFIHALKPLDWLLDGESGATPTICRWPVVWRGWIRLLPLLSGPRER